MAITVNSMQNIIDVNSEFLELITLIFVGATSYLLFAFIFAKSHMKEFWDIAKSKL
jgi:ABC-type anion transport system duplicated permease subunit